MQKLILGIACAVLPWLGGVSFAQSTPPLPSIDAIEVKAGVWMLRTNSHVGNSTVVAVIDGKKAALLDVGMSFTARQLRSWLEQHGVSELVFAASSHHHADHTDGLAYLAEWAKPIFVTSHRQYERLLPATTKPVPWPGLPALGLPTLTVGGGESLHLGPHEIRIDVVPARRSHTDGDLIFDIDNGAVRYIGDHLFVDRYPVIDMEGGADLYGYLRTIDCIVKSSRVDAVIVPGHALFAPQPLASASPAQLAAWRGRLLDSIDEIRAMKARGADIEAAKAAGLPAKFAALVEKPFFVRESRWIETVYDALDAHQNMDAQCEAGRQEGR